MLSRCVFQLWSNNNARYLDNHAWPITPRRAVFCVLAVAVNRTTRERSDGIPAASRAGGDIKQASAASKCRLGFTRGISNDPRPDRPDSLVIAGEVRGVGVNLSGADDVATVEPVAWLDGR
jgi:hypothetical protein